MVETCQRLTRVYKVVYVKYKRLQTRLRMPAIIVGSLTGIASFGTQTFPEGAREFVAIIVGVISVGIAILNTIESFFKVSEITSGASATISALERLQDDVLKELALPVEDRATNGITYLREIYVRYQQILNQAPVSDLIHALDRSGAPIPQAGDQPDDATALSSGVIGAFTKVLFGSQGPLPVSAPPSQNQQERIANALLQHVFKNEAAQAGDGRPPEAAGLLGSIKSKVSAALGRAPADLPAHPLESIRVDGDVQAPQVPVDSIHLQDILAALRDIKEATATRPPDTSGSSSQATGSMIDVPAPTIELDETPKTPEDA